MASPSVGRLRRARRTCIGGRLRTNAKQPNALPTGPNQQRDGGLRREEAPQQVNLLCTRQIIQKRALRNRERLTVAAGILPCSRVIRSAKHLQIVTMGLQGAFVSGPPPRLLSSSQPLRCSSWTPLPTGPLRVSVPPQRRPSSLQMGLFGLGLPEVAVIAGIGILVFGPSKIAELGKDLGGVAGSVKKATSEFQDAMSESLAEADREIEAKKTARVESQEQKDGESTRTT